MMLTSLKFLIFFVVVFLLYWFVFKKNYKYQNIIILIASYTFYGLADWRMIPLLLLTTIVFYILAPKIQSAKTERLGSFLTTIGVILGVGILLYFKYFNFFIQSFSELFNSMGLQTNWHTFKIIMPLGVSYFTFKLISYLVEVHRGKMESCKDIVAFASFISFFPTITAGPIDRPNRFIPQLLKTRVFDSSLAIDGCRQILWGLFKKLVVANSLTPIIDNAWNSGNGFNLIVAMIMYTFQMYFDFSGYSDMAIGIGKLLGLKIAKNFNYPFFATSIQEFWRRWHMSLTSWLTDYVFMPLNVRFRNMGNFGIILAIIINMVLVGMWHGANWTFAVFGLYQGLLFIPVILKGNMGKKEKLIVNRYGLPKIMDVIKMCGIFALYTIGAVVFRAENVSDAWLHFEKMFQFGGIESHPQAILLFYALVILVIECVEWFQRDKDHGLVITGKGVLKYGWVRFILYLSLSFITLAYAGEQQQFIYFQF